MLRRDRNSIRFNAIIGSIVCFIASFSAHSSNLVSEREFLSILEDGNVDTIVESMERISNMSNRGRFVPILIDIFRENQVKYPNIRWSIMQLDVVRMQVAAILANSWYRGNIGDEKLKHDIHQYARKSINSTDIDVKLDAIAALGYFNNEDDVPLLVREAMSGSPRAFNYAVIGLLVMCVEEAKVALDNLVESERDPSRRKDLVEMRQRFKEVAGLSGAPLRCPNG